MDNNEEEKKEKKKSSINQFIEYISKLKIKKEENSEKYNSTNENSIKINSKNLNVQNKKIENEFENDLYYYTQFPNVSNPILFIAIIYFHHKKGSIIEYTYPSKQELIKNNNIKLLLDEKNKQLTSEKIIDDIFNQLTNFCLPDGIHFSTSDNQFFIIQNFKYPLYGISCYRQIKGENDIRKENTRNFTQKSICIISTLPLYSHLYSKLSITLEAYFYQDNLEDKNIISELYNNFIEDKFKMDINEIFLSFSVKKLLLFTKEKIFTIIKMILLEKKILAYSHISGNVCSFIYNLLSLIPGQFLFNLRHGNSVINYIKYLNMYGLPLIIFNNNYKFFPLVSLFDIDNIEKGNYGYLIGTTNQLILKEYTDNKKYDLLINIDTGKISINNNLNKDIFEISKNEKKLYQLINNKFKTLNLKFEKEFWINSLKEINDNKTNENEIFILDDFIRNEFKNYFTEFLSDLDLSINIIKTPNFSIIKLLTFQKDLNKKTTTILNNEIQKKSIKKIIQSHYNSDFILSWIKNTKSFYYWLKSHDEIIYNLSKYIIPNKPIPIILENGFSYMGNILNGIPNGNGTLTSFDNKYSYDGEFKEGLKNGFGKLVINDGTKYSGQFLNDVYNGNGVLCDKNGNIYEGDFEKGKFNGYGHYTLNNGNIYIGMFKNDLFNGKGQLIYKDGTVYDGEFINGKKNGYGIILYPSGLKTEGKFKDDVLIKNDN